MEDRQLYQLPWLLPFALVWKLQARLSPNPATPPGHLCTGATQPTLPRNQEPLLFLFFLSLSQGVEGGDWQGSAGKPLSHACGQGAGPVPHPSTEERCMGSGVAGRDGMTGVCCGSGLGWVGCKEEKAHTDLAGAPSLHLNKCQSRRQQPPVLGALPTTSLLSAVGWHGINPAQADGPV